MNPTSLHSSQVVTPNNGIAGASGWCFVVAIVVGFVAIIIGIFEDSKDGAWNLTPFHFSSAVKGTVLGSPTVEKGGETFFPYRFTLHYNRSCLTPKDAFDFKVPVLYLC